MAEHNSNHQDSTNLPPEREQKDLDSLPDEELTGQEDSTEEVKIEDGPPESPEESTPVEDRPAPPAEEESRFKEGQILTLVRVRFPGHAKAIPFLVGNRRFSYGQKVVAMSDRGMAVGYINSFPYKKTFDKSMLPIRTISKIATEDDLRKQKQNLSAEKNAELICVRLIDKHKLDMVLTHVELVQFGKKAVFYFNAPARVDFRGLVKDLVGELKMRIELRQITLRDRAAALGAVGPCGQGTCCSTFLEHYGNVSIKMAKNQNLTLLPGKLNGCCGQIKCCIRYENDVYSAKRLLLPKEGTILQALNGDIGRVRTLLVLEERFEMITTEGKIRLYVADQFASGKVMPSDYHFPQVFENVFDETSKVIGLETREEQKKDTLLAEGGPEELGDEVATMEEDEEDEDDLDDQDENEDPDEEEEADDSDSEEDEEDEENEENEEDSEEDTDSKEEEDNGPVPSPPQGQAPTPANHYSNTAGGQQRPPSNNERREDTRHHHHHHRRHRHRHHQHGGQGQQGGGQQNNRGGGGRDGGNRGGGPPPRR
jgi:cell fate regulator YaaT (PSP1 superfamily)